MSTASYHIAIFFTLMLGGLLISYAELLMLVVRATLLAFIGWVIPSVRHLPSPLFWPALATLRRLNDFIGGKP